ncbi:MBL fold metallo-hydrolase [Peribacillus psychrosaccharolyticus]|uniref:MBL fold metallo-hydrolase n=1 Tax=Peribacillus psychrosaccharolyticus TaxID=1407 RepID=UPI003D287077
MTGIAIILVLAALIGFFLGLLGIIKGNVKLLKLKNRKASFLFLLLSLVLFFVGGAMLPSETATSPAVKQEVKQSEKETVKEKTESPKIEKVEKKVEKVIDKEEVGTETDESAKLEVHFVDVGQGAAQIIITPAGKVMVIDGGNNDDEERMVSYLNKLGVKKVDILVGTHPDADHIGGIDAVIDAFDIGKVYMPKIQKDTLTFESVLRAVQNKGLKVTTAKAGIDLDLDSAISTKMIGPLAASDPDNNEMSAIIRLEYGNHSFLLTGDAGVDTEADLIQSGAELKSTVLLVGHHGSDHSTSPAFLQTVQPEYAVIQVGKNSYGHPTAGVLSKVTNAGAKIYRNDKDGTIVFTTNGKTISVDKNSWTYVGTEQKDTTKTTPVPTPAEKKPEASISKTGTIKATASIDNATPNPNENITVTVKVSDVNGKPVSNANVSLNLAFKSTDTTYEGVTDTNGIASIPFRIGRAAAGYTVKGDITVTANGQTANASTAFTPK